MRKVEFDGEKVIQRRFKEEEEKGDSKKKKKEIQRRRFKEEKGDSKKILKRRRVKKQMGTRSRYSEKSVTVVKVTDVRKPVVVIIVAIAVMIKHRVQLVVHSKKTVTLSFDTKFF